MRLIETDEKLQAVAVAAVDVVTSGLGRRVVELEVDRPQIAVVAEVQAALHVRVQGLHRPGVPLPELVPEGRVDRVFAVGAEDGTRRVEGQDSLHCGIPVLFPAIMTTMEEFLI